jgi:hypothetical protein
MGSEFAEPEKRPEQKQSVPINRQTSSGFHSTYKIHPVRSVQKNTPPEERRKIMDELAKSVTVDWRKPTRMRDLSNAPSTQQQSPITPEHEPASAPAQFSVKPEPTILASATLTLGILQQRNHSTEQPSDHQTKPKPRSTSDVGLRDKDNRVAQTIGEESGIRWDPATELFKVVIGGVIVGGKATLDAANDLYHQVLKSTQDQGGEQKKEEDNGKKKKKKQTKQTGKEGATDIPSWAKGQKPRTGESGKDFAKRLLDEKYGSGQYDTGPRSEYNRIKKYGDRKL